MEANYGRLEEVRNKRLLEVTINIIVYGLFILSVFMFFRDIFTYKLSLSNVYLLYVFILPLLIMFLDRKLNTKWLKILFYVLFMNVFSVFILVLMKKLRTDGIAASTLAASCGIFYINSSIVLYDVFSSFTTTELFIMNTITFSIICIITFLIINIWFSGSDSGVNPERAVNKRNNIDLEKDIHNL